MLTRKVLLVIAAFALAEPALAQNYPNRAIRIVVPFAPGTATDNLVRPLTESMSASLKQPVVIDNRVGAVGKIAAEHVAKSAPDGYTILAGATTVISANPALFKQLSYNPRTDFDAVIGLGTIPQVVVVNPSIPARTMAEFVAYAKQNQGKLFYGSGTAGNIIPMRILSDRLGLGMTNVSYKSPPQAITDVVAGRMAAMAVDASAVIGQIKGGGVRPLAVTSLREAPDPARRAAAGRHDSRVRAHRVLRPVRSQGHRSRDHPGALPGDARRRRARGPQAQPRQPGIRGSHQRPGGIRRIHRERDRPLGADGEGSEDRPGVRRRGPAQTFSSTTSIRASWLFPAASRPQRAVDVAHRQSRALPRRALPKHRAGPCTRRSLGPRMTGRSERA